MKLLIVGDIHCDFIGPKNRSDNFYNSFVEKIKQIDQIADVCNIENVVCLGDFFENYVVDYFEKIVYDLSPILSKRNWYSLVGNHDNKKIDGADIRGTSFGALVATGLLKEAKHLPSLLQNVNCDIFDYYKKDSFDNKKIFENKNLSIAFIHEFVMPDGTSENFEFKKCSESNYDIIFCGHYHYDFDVKIGKTRYVNPGSLMRLTINKKDSERNPKVIIFDTESGELDYVLLEVKNNVFSLNETNDINVLNFNSKFTEMLIDKNLTQGSSNDIIVLLKNNNVSKEIIDYIQKKTEETRDEH